MFGMIKNLWNDESGASMVEYGLLVALIAVIVAVGAALLGGRVNNLFSGITFGP
jgi:pilus assembly protein Flp/PilA